jgi:biliverdin reductase
LKDDQLAVAVIGQGRAGRARMRALAEHEGARLAAVVAREPAAGEPTFESVLADLEVDALILCTPHLLHAPGARAGLEAGKHVAVEYPLAPTASEGSALFALARTRERVLHVEHIELLSPGQAELRELAGPLGGPRGGSLHASGSSQGWIGDPRLAGSPGLGALARLHRLVDLFGPARVESASLESRVRGFRLEIALHFAAGGEVRLIEERGPGLPRALRWDIRCEHGNLGGPTSAPASGLFASDLDCFVERIRSGSPSYVSEERILHALGLVDAVDALLPG